MAYVDADLTILSQNLDRNVWHYKTNDAASVVVAASYFNSAASKIKAQDLIHVSYDLDGTPGVLRLVVTARTDTAVTVGGGVAAPTAPPAGGTGATAGAYDTANNRDTMITCVATMRTAMIAHGLLY